MISRIAQGCKEQYTQNSRAAIIASSHNLRYKALAVHHWMPRYTHVHAHETLEAVKGNRSMPPRCPVTFAKTKAMLGYDEDNLEAVETILPHLCPTVLRERISLLRVLDGFPPLLIPRPGTEFSMEYILYCALYYDQANCTLYSNRNVNLENNNKNTAPGLLWELKAHAQEAVVAFGYDDSDMMRKRVNQIWHSHLDVLKYKQYHSNKPIQRWATLEVKAIKDVKSHITALCALAFPSYCHQQKGPCDKANYKTHFEKAAQVAFALDPFADDLTLENFQEYSIGDHFELYKKFLALKGALANLELHSHYSQMPMKKLTGDVLEKYKVPIFEAFFNTVEVYLPKNKEEALLEQQKNCGLDLTMISLGKRLKKMKVVSDSEDDLPDYDVPVKKKAVVRRKNRTSSTKCMPGESDLDSMAETDITPQKRRVRPQEVVDFGRKNSQYMLDRLESSSISSYSREKMMAED